MPPEVIKEHGGITDWRNLVGTGPFEMTDWVDGSSSTRTRNPDYWGHDEKYPENRLPYVDEVRYLIIPEEATLQAALISGTIDLRGPSGSWIKSIDAVDSLQKTNPEIVLHTHYFRSTATFAANVRVPPFDDVRVRKAMQMALDLETIANTYWKGYASATPQGIVGAQGFYIPFEEWPDEVKKGYRYDPEGAEKLLDEAGYPRGADGTRFKTSARTLGGSSYAEITAAYWAEIGVDVEINDYSDWALYHADLFARSYEGMMGSLGGASYAAPVLVGWHRSDAQWNRPLHQWPELDALVDAALAATTFEEQQRWVREVDMYAIENHYQIWGPKAPQFWALQPWVIGYSGEFDLGPNEDSLVISRLWIDSQLKEEMGFYGSYPPCYRRAGRLFLSSSPFISCDMRAYIIRRLLLVIPTLLILSLIVFFSVRFIPGDTIDAMLGTVDFSAEVDREALERMLGLDVPGYVQYVRWLGDIFLRGSLGRSLVGNRDAIEETIVSRLPVTIQLGLMSIVIGLVIALPVGIYSAIRQDTSADYVGRSVAIVGLATPNFWLAMMIMLYPVIWWGWAPPMEVIQFTEDPLGSLGVFIIPSLILGTYLSAATMRITRTMMLEVLRQDYIRTAWSKGLRERAVVVRHAIKNALIPIVTLVGLQLPILVGGSVIMENIFNLPGLGRLMLAALTDRDYPMVSGVNLVFGAAVVGVNLMVDLLYGYLDPRVRYQ